MNLLQHIAQSRHLLRKSELKVADHVLLDPAAVMHSSMADLAHSVGISEPTIVRFCRAIGCSGFQDLKLKLAQSLAAGASFGQFAIHEDDSVADYSLKIFDTTLHTLMEVREKLDPVALQKKPSRPCPRPSVSSFMASAPPARWQPMPSTSSSGCC
nr:hypothetical protein GCM10020185_34270 [Pseudomonas brassicacearum subsp. brassicacearum]